MCIYHHGLGLMFGIHEYQNAYVTVPVRPRSNGNGVICSQECHGLTGVGSKRGDVNIVCYRISKPALNNMTKTQNAVYCFFLNTYIIRISNICTLTGD